MRCKASSARPPEAEQELYTNISGFQRLAFVSRRNGSG